ncbi:M14 family metallopeptidase [Cellulosilyticum ruminicola]|uniref:succinylglutamate desuccinylase/aspartoacylase domain-containing protein n=1 Tax=Cellulosilyticum ruminicola TaxID=425254 RepID=UPI0006D00FA2|nr:succinylglutamate desuccinylase/aspartoacylase family protein [Cellulosilyticum ruminicola]
MDLKSMLEQKNKKWKSEFKITETHSLPMYVICGKETGKTLVITAGVHGCEYVGMLTARKLYKNLNCQEMRGQVIILPLINEEGFYEESKQIVPMDGKNLNNVFPGRADGTISEKIAYAIEKDIYYHADFLIDLHGGDYNEKMSSLVFFPVEAKERVNAIAKEAAKRLPVSYRVQSIAKDGLYSYGTQCDIPAVLLEIGGEGKWQESEVTHCEKCVYHLMDYLKIIDFKEERSSQKEITQVIYEVAQANGFWYPMISLGKYVSKGEILGEIRNLEDEVLKRYTAAFDGEILYYTVALGVKEGDSLIAYGRE